MIANSWLFLVMAFVAGVLAGAEIPRFLEALYQRKLRASVSPKKEG